MSDSKPVCFVVMPFGLKPMAGGNGVPFYDFEKVYRVIIRNAVQQAGLIPIRADERLSSALIHSDMFKDLRDQPIVLADLSLDNPNVYYELGIRHVMSPTGTILMCRKGTALPFDVRLSRVIFYDYDGKSLDYEEAQNVVSRLTAALAEARRGQKPDSPVHALLEPVIRERETRENARPQFVQPQEDRFSQFSEYQRMIADHWRAQQLTFAQARAQVNDTFGWRALGYYCLKDGTPAERLETATHLQDLEQFRLAVELYQKTPQDELPLPVLHRYASAYSEATRDLDGAKKAIELTEAAFTRIKSMYPDEKTNQALHDLADAYRRLGGLQEWRWLLSRDPNHLEEAVASFAEAVSRLDDVRRRGNWRGPGIVAQVRLRYMLLLRVRDGDAERGDPEENLDAIMGIEPLDSDDPESVSWLRWLQAIAIADAGSDEAHDRAIEALAKDGKLRQNGQFSQVGRWQYRNLRRFIDQHLKAFRNPANVGRVAQVLQAGEDTDG